MSSTTPRRGRAGDAQGDVVEGPLEDGARVARRDDAARRRRVEEADLVGPVRDVTDDARAQQGCGRAGCERESVEVETGESEKEREDAHSSRSVQLPTEGSLQSRVVGRLLRPPLPCSLSAIRMTMRACGFRSANGAPASECERTKSARLGRRRGRGGRAGRTEAPRVDLGAQVERIAVRVERRVEQDRVPLSDVERDPVERRAKDGRVVGLDHLERVLVDRRVDDRVRARVDDAQADAAVGREHELGEVELPALGARGRRARRERAVVDALAVDELRVGRRSEEGLCARKRERGRVSRALIEGESELQEGRTPLRPCGERSESTRKSAESWYQSLSMITGARGRERVSRVLGRAEEEKGSERTWSMSKSRPRTSGSLGE